MRVDDGGGRGELVMASPPGEATASCTMMVFIFFSFCERRGSFAFFEVANRLLLPPCENNVVDLCVCLCMCVWCMCVRVGIETRKTNLSPIRESATIFGARKIHHTKTKKNAHTQSLSLGDNPFR